MGPYIMGLHCPSDGSQSAPPPSHFFPLPLPPFAPRLNSWRYVEHPLSKEDSSQVFLPRPHVHPLSEQNMKHQIIPPTPAPSNHFAPSFYPTMGKPQGGRFNQGHISIIIGKPPPWQTSQLSLFSRIIGVRFGGGGGRACKWRLFDFFSFFLAPPFSFPQIS